MKNTQEIQNEENNIQQNQLFLHTDRDRSLHKEKTSSDRTKRVGHLAHITIALCVITIVVCVYSVWQVTLSARTQKQMVQTVEQMIQEQEFDSARDTATRAKYEATDAGDFILKWFSGGTEKRIADREEQKFFELNSITIRISSKDFKKMDFTNAKEELIKSGFDENNFKLIEIPSNARKYKKVENGTVLNVIITDPTGEKKTDDFKATDKFLPGSYIEIQYLKKQ